jgi:hypothetical protein
MNWFRVDTRQPDRTRSSGLYPDTRILTLAFGTLNDTEGSSPKTKRGDRWPAVRLHITPESPESGREPHYRGNVRIDDKPTGTPIPLVERAQSGVNAANTSAGQLPEVLLRRTGGRGFYLPSQ